MSAEKLTVPNGRRNTSDASTAVRCTQAWLDAAETWLKASAPDRAYEALQGAQSALGLALYETWQAREGQRRREALHGEDSKEACLASSPDRT